VLIDLGQSPIANNLLQNSSENLRNEMYPLCTMTCDECSLVQLSLSINREKLFSDDYVYHSSYSSSWLEHCKIYAEKMAVFLDLGKNDHVIEIASNDGYLLEYFKNMGVGVLGVEPAGDVAQAALEKGIPTLIEFFGYDTALKLSTSYRPRLVIGNNVLAHVPDLHDFIKGFAALISDEGVITFEFPHLLNLIRNNQFDTIYHEHYSYLSLMSLIPLFAIHKLKIFDVEKLPTHGGSLRIFVAKQSSAWEIKASVNHTIKEEKEFDPRRKNVYETFQSNAITAKSEFLEEIRNLKRNNKKIAAYGAAAKGITFLNFCGIDGSTIDYIVDLNPNKQNKYMPGSNISVVSKDFFLQNQPDVLLVLAWNLADEIKAQISSVSTKKLRFLRAIPKLEYF
jgi:hypothetical protein